MEKKILQVVFDKMESRGWTLDDFKETYGFHKDYLGEVNEKFENGESEENELVWCSQFFSDIKALPIPKIAAENCALFLWVTFPYMNKQIRLFEDWGFKYTTLGFSCIKTNPKNGKPFFGIGYYAKSNCEVCLMGIKGNMKPVSNLVSSCVISPRREHSRKPDDARKRIVELFGDVPRIELFARQHVAGWDCWGNECQEEKSEQNNLRRCA